MDQSTSMDSAIRISAVIFQGERLLDDLIIEGDTGFHESKVW